MWELKGLLTPEEGKAGYQVLEEEDFVVILYRGREIARFSSSGATRESIREFLETEKTA